MPKQERHKTKFPGVYYIIGTAITTGKPEKIYYIAYRLDGKLIEEKAGRQLQDDMTLKRALNLRVQRLNRNEPSNKARREAQKARKLAEAGRWTIDRLWQEYAAQRPDLKGMTTDKNRYENHVKPLFGNKEPKDIVPLDVDRLRIKLMKNHSPATVRHALEIIRRLANFGVNKRLCAGLAFKITMPNIDNLKTEMLTPAQLSNLLKVIDENPQYQVAGQMMKMALFTGMRRSEIFSLAWVDVDFERGFITVRNSKGGKDTAIPLNAPARRLLEGIDQSEKSPFVFPGKDGHIKEAKRGLNAISLKTRLAKDLEARLPEDFRPMHGLRHTYASMLASSGVDLYTIGRLLTHKSTAMTARYAHLSDTRLKQASELAGQLVTESAPRRP